MPSSLFDMENFFIEWAWGKYVETTPWLWRKKRDTLSFEIIWKKVKEEIGEPVYKNSTSMISPHIIFQTQYTNKSGGVQNNRFRTEKETTSIVSVTLTKGFSRSVDTGILLPLPKHDQPKNDEPEEEKSTQGEGQTSEKRDTQASVSAEFGNYVQIRCDETTVVEKKQKWTVDTSITSHEGYVTEAKLVVDEVKTQNSFKMNVKLKGTMLVNIRDKKNNVVDTITGDIKTIISDRKLVNVKADTNDQSPWVTWTFEGKMEIKYGVRESVETSATPIAKFTKATQTENDE